MCRGGEGRGVIGLGTICAAAALPMPPVSARPRTVTGRLALPCWSRARRARCRNGYNLMMTAQGIINRPLFVPCTSALVMALKDKAQSVVDMVMVGQYTSLSFFPLNPI